MDREVAGGMMELLASLGVLLSGIYLVALGLAALVVPGRVKEFFANFATSARAHYLEMFLRMAAGVAIIQTAPRMWGSTPFLWFGWLLVGTTLVLIALPWPLHRRFADRVLPKATAAMPVVGGVALVAGLFILYALWAGIR